MPKAIGGRDPFNRQAIVTKSPWVSKNRRAFHKDYLFYTDFFVNTVKYRENDILARISQFHKWKTLSA